MALNLGNEIAIISNANSPMAQVLEGSGPVTMASRHGFGAVDNGLSVSVSSPTLGMSGPR